MAELSLALGLMALALMLALSIWAYRDMRRRSRSLGWAIAVFLLVLLLPIAGIIIYLLLRPSETLMAQYERALSQEVLLQQIETAATCPGCARAVQPNWIVCPECHVSLRRQCTHCGTALELHWQICPVCARVVGSGELPLTWTEAT